MTRPFRFGAQVWELHSAAEWTTAVRRIEELGYDVFLAADHVNFGLAPFPVLTAVAAATSRLRLGTLVLDNDFRNPVLLAKEAATVDVLSEGRLELGLGAGWLAADYEQTGIAYDSPGVRVDRLEAAVDIVAALFAGEPVDHDGAHYRVRVQDKVEPTPVQQPRPPILIGGGSQRILGLAGRAADIAQVCPRTIQNQGLDVSDSGPDAVERKVGWVTAEGDPELSTIVFATVAGERRAAAEQIAAQLAARGTALSPEQALASPHVLAGTPEQMAEEITSWRDSWGITYIVVQRDFEAFAPVIALLRTADSA